MIFYHEKTETRYSTFEAMKEAILHALQPVVRQVERSAKNGIPLTPGVVAELKTNVNELEFWLHGLKMMDVSEAPKGRRTIARPAKILTHSPGDANYAIEPPSKKR